MYNTVMPLSAMDRSVRGTVLAAALAIVEEEGPAGLSVRRLAADAGTSTMSVYTHFGSIAAVVAAVIERGFMTLAEQLTAAGTSDDPLADIFTLALAYLEFARQHPQLYATMFQYTSTEWTPNRRQSPVEAGSPTTSTAGTAAFSTFSSMLGRLTNDNKETGFGLAVLGAQCWSAVHGVAMLRLVGHLGDDDVAQSLLIALAVGNGADRAAAQRAFTKATKRHIEHA